MWFANLSSAFSAPVLELIQATSELAPLGGKQVLRQETPIAIYLASPKPLAKPDQTKSEQPYGSRTK